MAELPLPEKGQQISEHSDPPKASPGLPEPPPPAAPENAASDVQIGDQVIWCSRPGHPGPYAHTHPYISALCADGEHITCTLIGVESGAPDFCDCECGHVC